MCGCCDRDNMKAQIAIIFALIGLSFATYPIYDELLDISDQIVVPRQRREATCYDVKSCCDVSNFHKDDSMKICTEELHIEGKPTNEQIKCIAECMAKKDGYLDGNGLNRDKLKEVLISKLSTAVNWLTSDEIVRIIDACIGNTESGGIPSNTCNDIAMVMGHCVAAEIQVYCPINEQRDQEKCASLQNYMKEHKNLPSRKDWC